MTDQKHAEDLMFSVLEIFCKKGSLKLKSVWPLHFSDNKEYPPFKPAEVEDAVRSHAKVN